ncbi:MAG: hypothetical protein Q4C45_05640 [Oscillospiraceae bacterium]|nr:hypothetical protein [Oscillospiraceae bacterium]
MMSSRQMALCGVLTALAVVILLLGGATGIGTFAAPVLAMAALLPVLEEYGAKSAGTAYGAAALLALLLAPDRELALVYAGFGWYPILRPRIARISSRLARTAARLVICNGVILVLYGALLRLLGLTADLAGASRVMNAALLVLGNLVFLLLDVVLARLTNLWRRKLRKRFFHT